MCGVYINLLFSHLPRDYPITVSNYKNYTCEIKTDQTDLTDGLKVDVIKNFEKLNNLGIKFLKVNDDESPIQLLPQKTTTNAKTTLKTTRWTAVRKNNWIIKKLSVTNS